MTHHATDIRPDAGTKTILVDQLQDFDALRSDWSALYLRDPDAHVFLDWSVLRRAFADHPSRWSVIIVRSGADDTLIAALPLKYRVHWSQSKSELQTQLEPASDLVAGVYSGLLCDPQHEASALAQLARSLAHIPWVQLALPYCPQLERLQAFGDHLAAHGCQIEWTSGPSGSRRSKRTSSKVVLLPETMADFLETQVSPEQADDYRLWKADAEGPGDTTITTTNPASLSADMAALQTMLDALDDSRLAKKLKAAQPSIETAASRSRLILPVAWAEHRPVGALVHLHDPVQGTLTRILDLIPETAEPALRPLLTLFSIEAAIETECLIYDCGRISKKDIAVKIVHREKSLSLVARRAPADPTLRFDPLCTGLALQRVQSFVEADKKTAALAACAQLTGLFCGQQ